MRRFQAKHDLPVTGIATPQLLQLSAERIVVHLNRFRVDLIRDGKKVFSAPIAIGMPAHPTPTGAYEIIAKIKNPTWVPPNSPWAAGLEPIPPGVEQPARHALDRHERAEYRLPRHARRLQRRPRRLPRLHAHAPPRRGTALRSDSRGYAGRHRGVRRR